MSFRESLSLGLTDSRTVAANVVDNTTINGPNYTTSRDATNASIRRAMSPFRGEQRPQGTLRLGPLLWRTRALRGAGGPVADPPNVTVRRPDRWTDWTAALATHPSRAVGAAALGRSLGARRRDPGVHSEV